MDQKTLKLLQKADWEAIRSELLACAMWQASSYRWKHKGNSNLARGETVEDVVQEVIVKTLSGVRRWDPDKGQLLPWLQAQSRSIIDALVKSASHHREVSILEESNLVFAQSPDPLEIVLEREAEAQVEQKVNVLFQAVVEEPELKEVLCAIMNGCEPWPRHIASELGVSVREIDNRLKRLRRCASRLIDGSM